MSWNIKTPGDYINGPLTVAGAATFSSQVTVNSTLQVTGNVAGQGALIGRDGASGGATYGSNTGNTNINSPASGTVRFNVNNGTFAGLFDTNGYLGIGVSSPISLLDVRNGYITCGTATAVSGPKLLGGYYGNGNLTTLGSEQANGGPVLSYGLWPSTTASGSFTSSTGINVARGSYIIRGNAHIWFGSTGASTTAIGDAVPVNQNMVLDGSGVLLLGLPSANVNGGCLQLKSGITMPATQVASTDANTLDDYEEGTWIGTLKGSVSDPTVAVTATGRYTKVGRQVTVQIAFENVTTTGASGSVSISNLPFTNNSSIRAMGSVGVFQGIVFTETLAAILGAGQNTIELYSIKSNIGYNAATHSATSSVYVWANVTYTV